MPKRAVEILGFITGLANRVKKLRQYPAMQHLGMQLLHRYGISIYPLSLGLPCGNKTVSCFY